MKSHRARLAVFSGLGLLAGFLAFWRVARDPGTVDATDLVQSTASADAAPDSSSALPLAKAGDGTDSGSALLRDEVFKVFPEDQWIRVPRGLMEHGNCGLDSFLNFSGDSSEDTVVFLGANLPGANEPTVQTIANLILRFSRDWAQIAADSLQRSGPNEWQVSVSPDRVARLRKDFGQNLTISLSPGYAHLVGVLNSKPFSTLNTPSMTLTFDSSSNLWKLRQRRGKTVMTTNFSETSLGKNAPIRLLFQRARTLGTGQSASRSTTDQNSMSKTNESYIDAESLISQINDPDALQRSSEIWMPRYVARRFNYSIGSISTKYEMGEEAQAALGLKDYTRLDIELATNNLLAEIRELESQKLEIVEQTDDLVHIKIPAGFAPQSRLQEYRAQMEEFLGPVRADLFLRTFLYDLRAVTTAFTDSARHIRISSQGKVGIEIEIQQNDRTEGMGSSVDTMKDWAASMPDYLEHIAQAVQDKELK